MKRRLICFILATVMTVFCTACGNDENSSDTDTKKPSQSESSTANKPSHTHSWSEWETDPNDSLNDIRTCECGETETRLKSATPKGVYHGNSAGYSKWIGSNGETIRNSALKDVYNVPNDEEIELLGGAYFISTIGEVQYLKKYDGTVICSTESLGITGFGMTDNYTSNLDFLADGYVFGYKITETYSKITYEIGILGVDGSWIVPLSDSHPIVTSGMTLNKDAFFEDLCYCGDGVITLTVNLDDYDYEYMIYNIEKNATYRYHGYNMGTMTEYLLADPEFSDGIAYEYYNSCYYKLTSIGEISCVGLIPEETSCFSHYGTYIGENGTYYSLISNGWHMQLCSQDKIIRDLEDVNITNARQLGDKWLICIENAEKTRYYTLLKTDGSFAFEPIKITAWTIYFEDGKYIEFDDGLMATASGGKIVVSNDGEIIYEVPIGVAEFSIKNGVVCENGDYKYLPDSPIVSAE